MRTDAIMTTHAAWGHPHGLEKMRVARVRRLPVLGASGRHGGLVSIDDIVLAAQNVRAGAGRVSFEPAMAALDAICARSIGKETPHGDAQQHPRAD